MSLSALLNKVVTLQRPEITQDSSGGSVRTFQDVQGATVIPAGIQPKLYSEKQRFGGRQLFSTNVVYFDQDYNVQRGDIILDLTTTPNRVYVVLSYQNQAGQDYFYSVDVREQLQ